MPELPEVEALAEFLREHAVGHAVVGVDVTAFQALKTVDPPVTALAGLLVTCVARHGKFLDVDCDGLHFVTHLARGGWLRWRDDLTGAKPVRPGKGPLAVRVRLSPDEDGRAPGFELTEAGTQKRLAVYVVRDPEDVPGIAGLGPDPLAEGFTPDLLKTIVGGSRTQIKGLLRDQKVIAGIGNAYSDEVLHVAKMSPFKIAGTLTDGQVADLHDAIVSTLRDAVGRARGWRPRTSSRRRSRACACTAVRARRARCAATRSGRSRSPTRRCSTARPARPAANRWPTAGCPACSSRPREERPDLQRVLRITVGHSSPHGPGHRWCAVRMGA
ncbi:hypothetical protein GCM10027612_09710 [Microbispora bryophytorum subsp. camponoti]